MTISFKMQSLELRSSRELSNASFKSVLHLQGKVTMFDFAVGVE